MSTDVSLLEGMSAVGLLCIALAVYTKAIIKPVLDRWA